MGQTEIIVDMMQGQLLPQALLALAERADSPSNRGHMLADVSAILGSLDVVFGEIDR